MSVIAVIQARVGSTRLPGKVLKPMGSKPAIGWVVERVGQCAAINRVILATTDSPLDDALAAWAGEAGVTCFRGSETDVLGRYYGASLSAGAGPDDIIVRITGDCPLIDPDVCALVVKKIRETNADYVSNVDPPTYPDGLDCEAMRFSALARSHNEAVLGYEREHVTQFILRRPQLFQRVNIKNDADLSHMRWTLDEPEDYSFLCAVINGMGKDNFRMRDVLAYLASHPDTAPINARFERNEGLQKSIREESKS